MPTQQRVREFIDEVERGHFMQALREYYNPDVAMQENCEPPRVGLAACLDQESRFLESVEAFHEIHAQTCLIDGDRVAILWLFELSLKDGRRVRREEMTFQRWEGDHILCERFFYDPKPAPVTAPAPLNLVLEVDERGEVTLPAAFVQTNRIAAGDKLAFSGSQLALTVGGDV